MSWDTTLVLRWRGEWRGTSCSLSLDCCLSCKPEVPGQADYSSVTWMFLVFYRVLVVGRRFVSGMLRCCRCTEHLYERTLTAVRCLTEEMFSLNERLALQDGRMLDARREARGYAQPKQTHQIKPGLLGDRSMVH